MLWNLGFRVLGLGFGVWGAFGVSGFGVVGFLGGFGLRFKIYDLGPKYVDVSTNLSIQGTRVLVVACVHLARVARVEVLGISFEEGLGSLGRL